jgi:glycosyltransferase involved in cell wall biosynthesis
LRKLQILEIIPSCRRGGVPTVVHNLVRHIDRERFDIRLVAPDDGPFYEIFSQLCPVHKVRIRGYYPGSIYALRKLIKTHRIDVVHAHGKGAALYGRLASFGLKTKKVYTLHGFDDGHYRPLVRWVYLSVEKVLARITDKTVAVSDGERKKAERAGILVPARSAVIPNGVAINRHTSRPVRGHVLGTLSRTSPQKGLEFLVEALAALKERYPDSICYVAGGTPVGEEDYEAAIKRMARERGAEGRMVFLGEISDIEAFFSRIDVYVSTSRWEGLPTAILEAFAAGTPVVATDVVGNQDLVSNLETGVLVQADDGKAIAKGIEFAFENRDRIEALAERARRLVAERYSIDNMVRQHEELYKNLAGFGANDAALDREERDMEKEALPQP